MAHGGGCFFQIRDKRHTHTVGEGVKHHILTETVVSVMCQAEAVVARAPVISWDVDALVDTAAVVLGRALIHI